MAGRNRTAALKSGSNTYKVRFSTNALAEFEEAHGATFLEAMQALGDGNISFLTLRRLVWAGLKDHHDLDLVAVGDLMDDAGFEVVTEAITNAAALAFPQVEDVGGNGEAGTPG